jgi:hypothetical protein
MRKIAAFQTAREQRKTPCAAKNRSVVKFAYYCLFSITYTDFALTDAHTLAKVAAT